MSSSKIEIKVFDMNHVLNNPELEFMLRELSLGYNAGMSTQLNRFKSIIAERPVDARAVVGYLGQDAVGWALSSKEGTNRHAQYDPSLGVLIYIFVNLKFRRMGVGSAILNECRKIAGEEKLCVCPWDEQAAEFYYKNRSHNLFNILPYKQIALGEDRSLYNSY